MRILFFAQVRQVIGCAAVELSPGEVDTNGLWQALIASHPRLAEYRQSVRLARNGRFAGADEHFVDSDEVALIPPVSGG